MNILENKNIIIQVNDSGAELCRIYSKENSKEYLWNGDSKYWGRYSPVLFPIVGRLNDNETYIQGEKYQMGQHGFARDMEFELLNKTEDSMEFSLQYNEETLKKYPYKFKLNIIYKLEDSKVDVTWVVKNLDDKEIFFSIGAHPAFNVPFSKEDNIEDCFLTFRNRDNVKQYTLEGPYVGSNKEIEGIEKLDLRANLFENDALVYSGVDEITINSTKSKEKIKVTFDNFPYVGIWSPYYKENDTVAPFLCIEPWYGVADEVNSNKDYSTKLGINKLEINEEFKCKYSISLI
ncbi:aldose 1-epimerase family protein [Romboutsia sp.]|uniref:aldose 1-epimerase family protein n=1 Tax=Romboutsia sp. TaxID=1965302 RepID=UPI003F392943